jgi:uncharacterized membrane protein
VFPAFFKYPLSLFSKGEFVFLSPWPRWLLGLGIAAIAVGLALLMIRHLPPGASRPMRARAGLIWFLQTLLMSALLIVLWRPGLAVNELSSQQNIVAFLVDDSRSMAITEAGSSREDQAIQALTGLLAGVASSYQTRLYRFDEHLALAPDLQTVRPTGAATHVASALKQLADETSGLPLGAVVLLSDGSDNGRGVDADSLAALRDRHIPVHTVGFGREQAEQDIEVEEVAVAPRALADSRVAATVRFHQRGYNGVKSRLTVREGTREITSQAVTFTADGKPQAETLLFDVGSAGIKALQFSLDSAPGEENAANNAMTRLVDVDSERRDVLYVEGEPRWEYKFIRRAAEDDRQLRLVSMLRTSENKIYRQNVRNAEELSQGFPTHARELFGYQALVIGSVEAGYFTPAQQQLIHAFVDRRGGGVLFLGGRYALADGGWGSSNLAGVLPTVLPDAKNTFHVDPATAQLAAAGAESTITRFQDDAAASAERWKKLPYLMDYQNAGVPKAGATVLANFTAEGHTLPLLVTQSYGRGRSALLATSGTWRWQMNLPAGDPTFAAFWQQLLRWMVTDSHGPVAASVDRAEIQDDGGASLFAEVRNEDFQPVPDAQVEARILGPGSVSAKAPMSPIAGKPGLYRVDWSADQPGDYLAEIVAQHDGTPLGRDVVHFRRMDGVAENFHTEQNRELLERIAALTGGRYWRPDNLSGLPEQISLSPAGITAHGTKELWDMPAIFLSILLLAMSEWLVRRAWGIV